MNTICFLSGVGVQELILIFTFLALLGAPVVLVVIIVRLVRKRNSTAVSASVSDKGQTPILRNADKLKELKSLQDKGIISGEEFEEEKRKILAGEG
jgi:hypothetical protein